jgi:hypothetical protein
MQEDLITSFYDLNNIKLETEQVLKYLNDIYQSVVKINSLKLDLDKAGSIRILTELATQLKTSIDSLASAQTKLGDEAVKSTKKQVDAYTQLKQQYKEAETNVRAMAAQYGAQSDQAIKAAQSLEQYRQKLSEINSLVKSGGKQDAPIPFTTNLAELEAERTAAEKTGEAVNDLDRSQAEAANSATAMGAAMQETGTHTGTVKDNVEGIVLSLDEYTGSLRQNLTAQIENNLALSNNKAQQKEIENAIKASGTATDQQIAKLAELKEEALVLNETNKNLSTTIRNQGKEYIASAGSIDEMQAKVNLLQHTYEQLTAAEKAAPFGKAIKSQIDTLEPALVAAEAELGKNQRKVGDYTNSITKAFSGAYGYLRQIANILPGIGIAGIIGLLADGVMSLASDFFTGSKATSLWAENLKNLNDVMEDANKQAGKQIADSRVLYETATNVNNSMQDRLAAVHALKTEFPDYFSKINDEIILNGKAKNSYDALAQSIKESARASAAMDKVKALTSQILDLEDKQQKTVNATKNNIDKVAPGVNDYINEDGTVTRRNQANQRAYISSIGDKAFQDLEAKKEDIENQIDFLVNQVGKKAVAKSVEDGIKGNKGSGPGSKDYMDDLFRQLEETRKAQFESEQQQLKDKTAFDKSMAESDKNSFQVRLDAAKAFYDDSLKALGSQKDFDLKDNDLKIAEETRKVKEQLKSGKLTVQQKQDLEAELTAITQKGAANRELILAKYNTAVFDLNEQSEKQITGIVKDNNDEQARIRKEAVQKQIEAAQAKKDDTLSKIEQEALAETQFNVDRYKKGEITKQEYENNKLKIENKARRDSLLAEVEYQEDLLKISNLSVEERAKAEKALAEVRRKLLAQDIKDTEQATDAKQKAIDDYHKKVKEKLLDLGKALEDTFFTVLEAGVTRQKNAIQEQIDGLDTLTQKQIEGVNASVLSEQDKAAKIAIINARAQAQKEQLAQKQRHLDEQNARFQRAKAVVDIATNTAIGITKAIAEVPKADFGISTAALIAIYSAIGAAEIAAVLAQPIPKYFKGKNLDSLDNYAGPAIVGDGGKAEAIIREGGGIEITPNVPTLTHIGANDIILPDANMLAMMGTRDSLLALAVQNKPDGSAIIAKEVRGMKKDVVQAIKSIPQHQITVENVLKNAIKSPGSIKNYLNK